MNSDAFFNWHKHSVGGLGSDVCGWANSAATKRKTSGRGYVAALPPTFGALRQFKFLPIRK
jgi:hypothetical protein